MDATRAPDRPLVPARSSPLASWPWWTLALAAAGVFMVYLIVTNANYRDTFIFLQAGVATTLRITLIAFPIATFIGLITGLARTSKNVVIFNAATLYVETIRGIPMIVLILYTAFVLLPLIIEPIHSLGAFGQRTFGTGFLGGFFESLASFSIRVVSMEARAIIALAVGYGAFEAEVFRAGIQSIGKGQMEAARSLGMSYFHAMRLVILPQAVRRILPPLGNDFIALLKDSSLATVIAVSEVTQLGRLRRASTFRSLETYNMVLFLYLSMTLLLSAAVRYIEKKFKYEE
jgi:polar amino acid transport system permease protein